MTICRLRRWPLTAAMLLLTATLLPACGKKKQPEKSAKPTAAAGAESAKPEAAAKKEAPSGPMRVFFVEPKDNTEVQNPLEANGKVRVTVKFGIEGMVVKPAGTNVPNSGHHHVIIDGGPIPEGQPVPMDERHLHFGKGQLDAVVLLTPGRHTLTMQFADFTHVSYGPKMASTVAITVTETVPPPEKAGNAEAAKEIVAPTGEAADKAAAKAAEAAGTPVTSANSNAASDEAKKVVEATAKAAQAAAKAAQAVNETKGK